MWDRVCIFMGVSDTVYGCTRNKSLKVIGIFPSFGKKENNRVPGLEHQHKIACHRLLSRKDMIHPCCYRIQAKSLVDARSQRILMLIHALNSDASDFRSSTELADSLTGNMLN